MTEEAKQVQEPNITNPTAQAPQPAEPVQQPTATAPEKTGGTYSEADVERIIKERLDREKVKREKATEEAARKAAEEAAAKNQEWQKLAEQRAKDLETIQAQLKARELADLKRTIAEKVGIPAGLAARLVGDTEDDLEADAKALLETLPKPPPPTPDKPKQPGISPANPGANGQVGLTIEQQRERIYGARQDPWSVEANRQQGGGAYLQSKE